MRSTSPGSPPILRCGVDGGAKMRDIAGFGPLLRRFRIEAGLTQEQLAERAQLSARGLGYLEQGVRRPYPETLRRLADALALTPEQHAAFMDAARAAQARARRAQPPGYAESPSDGTLPTPATLPLPPTPLIGRAAVVEAVARAPPPAGGPAADAHRAGRRGQDAARAGSRPLHARRLRRRRRLRRARAARRPGVRAAGDRPRARHPAGRSPARSRRGWPRRCASGRCS